MASFTASGLTPHSIFNEFDSQGLLLSLPRLQEERNPAYKARLLDVFVNRSSSTYQGLINGITRELGLSITDTMTITNTLDGNGDPVLTFPATVFEETKCTLYSDFGNSTILAEFDRFDVDGNYYTLEELASGINATGYFTATLDSSVPTNQRSMTIYNQSSVKIVENEFLTGKGQRIKLNNENLVLDTVSIVSENMTNRVDSEGNISISGDYYVDRDNGMIITNVIPAPGSRVRYQYRADTQVFKSSPVILHTLQSSDFKTKMFEQITDEDGNTVNGPPTILGASLINELLSVFPSNWGI